MLKQSRGNITPQQVLRCAQLSGPYGRQMDQLFTQSGLGDMDTRDCRQQIPEYKSDIDRFVAEYACDRLCSYRPGRTHLGLRNFNYQRKLKKSPVKLGVHLKHLAENLDNFRRLAIQNDQIDAS